MRKRTRAEVLAEPSVPLPIVVHCPPAEHRQSVSICLHNYFEVPDHPLGCQGCPVIQQHLTQYGMRSVHRVPVGCTALALTLSDGTLTTVVDWKVIEVLGEKRYSKRIKGKLYHFSLDEAVKLGIPEAFPAAFSKERMLKLPAAYVPAKGRFTGTLAHLNADAFPEYDPPIPRTRKQERREMWDNLRRWHVAVAKMNAPRGK